MSDGSMEGATKTKLFDFKLLPGKCPPAYHATQLHDATFRFWRGFWTDVFATISPGESVNVADFHRQNAIGAFFDREIPVALMLYSVWNLASESALAQGYFSASYGPGELERLRARGVRTAMSMEYLTVAPHCRKSETGFSMASLVLGVSYETMKRLECDAMIAPCRMDVKVHDRVADFGAEPLGVPFEIHGVHAVCMVAPTQSLRTHPDPHVARVVQDHWQRARDLGGNLPWKTNADLPWKRAPSEFQVPIVA